MSTIAMNEVYPRSRVAAGNSQPGSLPAASGAAGATAGMVNGPAMSWLGLLALLVLLRVVYELVPEG